MSSLVAVSSPAATRTLCTFSDSTFENFAVRWLKYKAPKQHAATSTTLTKTVGASSFSDKRRWNTNGLAQRGRRPSSIIPAGLKVRAGAKAVNRRERNVVAQVLPAPPGFDRLASLWTYRRGWR